MSVRRRAEEIFEAALDARPEERAALVYAAAGGDASVLHDVQSLLAAHDRTDGILDLDVRTLLDPGEAVPERLGAYRVVREIRRGGMGVVYEAERDDGQFRRRVAIKILRAGDERGLRQRVLAERQILAGLDHPGIARLLDGGVTGDGRPYLVMEHVDGLPIDVFCDRMRLDVAERLRLFIEVARAVAFAHHNLVVHRDLKPSNILVSTDGSVKLLDFGVAKMLNPALGVASATLPDQLALTPEYASPEQLRGETLTTQSDVFALGALLYELLTGRRAFAGAGLAALVRAVCEDDVARPSEAVLHDAVQPALDGSSRTIAAVATAHARQSTPQRLSRALRGDLDAVVLHALRREPRHRYGSAELFARDIEAYLDGRPVAAIGRGRAYALGKLVRRHRATAAALSLAVLSLLGGTATSLWQAREARAQRDQAVATRAQAEQVTGFMVDLFSSGAPGGPVQGQVSASDLVRRGTARIDGLASQPVVQASLLGALGRAYEGLGHYDEAQRLTQRALDVHNALQQRDAHALGALLLQLGILQRRRAEYDSAQASFFAARAAVPDVAAAPVLVGQILQQLQSIAIYRGDLIEAERRAEDGFVQLRATLGETHAVTVNALSDLASVRWRRGRLDAEALYRQVIDLRAGVPGHTRVHLMNDRMSLANFLLTERLRLDEAEATFRAVIQATQDVPEHMNLVVWARANLGLIHESRGEFREAERLHRANLALRRALHGDDHPIVGGSFGELGKSLARAGRLREAQIYLDSSGVIVRSVFGERHILFSGWLADVAWLHLLRGDASSADTLMEHSVALREQVGGRVGEAFALTLSAHAEVKIARGDFARAEAMLNEALAIARPQLVDGARGLRRIHATFAELYTASGRPQDAARHRALALPRPIVQ